MLLIGTVSMLVLAVGAIAANETSPSDVMV